MSSNCQSSPVQVAKRVVFRHPLLTTRSLSYVKDHLQSLKQLTDPSLNLELLLKNQDLFGVSTAGLHKPVDWLRACLGFSHEVLKFVLQRNPGILVRLQVNPQERHPSTGMLAMITKCTLVERASLLAESTSSCVGLADTHTCIPCQPWKAWNHISGRLAALSPG